MSEVHPAQSCLSGRILDRIRLQFLPAGNWKRVLANSNLPQGVQTLIREVVQPTGLLRFEKSEIATELIHHFLDGHESGRSFEELVRDFGTTEVAVSLFRSSKLRSRPMSVKAFRGSMIVFGGGLIGFLMLHLFFRSELPNPSVDYSEKLNDAVTSMPVEQQAWPLYREAWVKHGLVENGTSYSELWFRESDADAPEVEWTDHVTHRRLIRPEDKGWDKATARLDSLEELLTVLRKGSKLPYLGTPLHSDIRKYSDEDLAALFPGRTREMIEKDDRSLIDSFGLDLANVSEEADALLSSSTMSILLPHIQQFRRAARVLKVDTRYAMQQGDHQRAIANVETIFGLGRQAGNNPVTVCKLVGLAVQGIGFEVIEELVVEHEENLSDLELQQLQSIAATADFTHTYDDLSFEKNFALDTIQRIYSDDGKGDGRMTAVGLEVQYVVTNLGGAMTLEDDPWYEGKLVRNITAPVSMFTAPSRKEMESLIEESWEELNSLIDQPLWQAINSGSNFEDMLVRKDNSGLLGSLMLLPQNMLQQREVKIARQDAVLLALAMHRFQRTNDVWPTTLDQLSDKWMDRTPIDRLSGKPLSFAIVDSRPVVYSLGRDGVDDGGNPMNTNAPWLVSESEGDWVLWPMND